MPPMFVLLRTDLVTVFLHLVTRGLLVTNLSCSLARLFPLMTMNKRIDELNNVVAIYTSLLISLPKECTKMAIAVLG
jgi:hypothetical protein